MRQFKLVRVLLIAAPFALVAAAAHGQSTSKSPRNAQAKMTPQEVRAKCIRDFQQSTGSTGPKTAQEAMGNNHKYMACVHRYGVSP